MTGTSRPWFAGAGSVAAAGGTEALPEIFDSAAILCSTSRLDRLQPPIPRRGPQSGSQLWDRDPRLPAPQRGGGRMINRRLHSFPDGLSCRQIEAIANRSLQLRRSPPYGSCARRPTADRLSGCGRQRALRSGSGVDDSIPFHALRRGQHVQVEFRQVEIAHAIDQRRWAVRFAQRRGKAPRQRVWWALKDLNLRPTDYESAALTAELRARFFNLPSYMGSRVPLGGAGSELAGSGGSSAMI